MDTARFIEFLFVLGLRQTGAPCCNFQLQAYLHYRYDLEYWPDVSAARSQFAIVRARAPPSVPKPPGPSSAGGCLWSPACGIHGLSRRWCPMETLHFKPPAAQGWTLGCYEDAATELTKEEAKRARYRRRRGCLEPGVLRDVRAAVAAVGSGLENRGSAALAGRELGATWPACVT